MSTALFIAAALLWIAWAAQAILAALLVRKFASRFLRPRRASFDHHRPRAAVMVPCKGVEPGLADHLARLSEQDYPDYRLVFIVESEDDPAHPLVTGHARRYADRRAIDVVVAGRAPPDVGQKVHNQLAALEHLRQLGAGETVWVFADSDAAPHPRWLGDLVGPLGQGDKTAVTTGYRWLFPVGERGQGAKGPGGQGVDDKSDNATHSVPRSLDPSIPSPPTFWSRLASVLNASAACFAGREQFNHAWGGSMAMTTETARAGDLVDRLRGALSDDYRVTAMARSLGKRIYFVPACLVRSPVALDRRGFANFVHRQYLITRLHAPGVFYLAAAVLWLYTLGMLTAWASLVAGLALAPASPWVWLAAFAIAVVITANQCRASFRRRVIRLAFGEEALEELGATLRLDRWGAWLWMPLNAAMMTRAALGRTLTWRGRRYRIHAPQRIQRLP